MALSFYSTTTIDVSQNVNLYDYIEQPSTTFEFVFEVQVSDMNSLFTTRQYMESTTNNENVWIDLTVDQDFVNSLFVSESSIINTTSDLLVSSGGREYTFQTQIMSTIQDSATPTILGRRFSEVAAIKIFGSAYASAALRNDKQFTGGNDISGSIYNQIISGMSSQLSGNHEYGQDTQSNDIFKHWNAYVASGRYTQTSGNTTDGTDETKAGLFNFSGTNWYFPITLRGDVLDSTGNIISSINPAVRYGSTYDNPFNIIIGFISPH